MKVGESKAETSLWLDYRIANRVMCSLEGGYASKGVEKEAKQRCVNRGAQRHRAGEDKHFVGLGCDYPPGPAQLEIYDQITL